MQDLIQKEAVILETTALQLSRGMTEEECKIICTSPQIPIREKLFFRILYETEFRPFETLNLQIEDWDRKQALVTARRTKQKTRPVPGDNRKKIWLPSNPRTMMISPATNEMLRVYVGNRKKGAIFINRAGNKLSLEWFNQAINKYATLLGIQKEVHKYKDGRSLKLITCMSCREAGERHHDNAGGSRKLSAVAAGHTMQVKEQHYEKVGDNFEQVWESYRKFHPAFQW